MGDCRDVLRLVPDESVHLVLTDPPYGISHDDWDVLHTNTNSALLGKSPAQVSTGSVFAKRRKPINGWSSADRQIPYEYEKWCRTWSVELYRILKPGGSALVFASRRLAHRTTVALEDAGLLVRDQIAWKRPQAPHRAQRLSVVLDRRGLHQEAEYWKDWRLGNLRPVFEPILWFFKPYAYTVTDNVLQHGVGAWNQEALVSVVGGFENVIQCGFGSDDDPRLHPAQKPLRLIRGIIELTTLPGQLVLDPFAGSGTTGVAAVHGGREAVLIEERLEYAQISIERIRSYCAGSKSTANQGSLW